MLERGVILQRTLKQLQTSSYFEGRCTEQNFLVDIKKRKSFLVDIKRRKSYQSQSIFGSSSVREPDLIR